MASWGEANGRTLALEREHRCLGCGVHIDSAFTAGMVPLCLRCLEADRPVDPVMRWIWYGVAARR